MKTKTVSLRIDADEDRRWRKAAREHKNLSAFFISAARDRIRYRKIMDEIKRYDRMFKRSVVMKVFETAIVEAAERLKVDA